MLFSANVSAAEPSSSSTPTENNHSSPYDGGGFLRVAVELSDMDLQTLRAAFEDGGYEVGDVSRNRNQIRVVLLEEGAPAENLRSITYGVVDEEAVFGLNITTESVDGHDGMNTVVTFRSRS